MERNIIVLQNRGIWKECMELDLVTRNKKLITRKDENNPKINGHYSRIGNDLVMLYRKDGFLFLAINDKETNLDVDNPKLSYTREGRNIRFVLKKDDNTVYQITYPSFRYDELNMLDIDFNEFREEDQDFFLFVFNVFNNSARMKRIYTEEYT